MTLDLIDQEYITNIIKIFTVESDIYPDLCSISYELQGGESFAHLTFDEDHVLLRVDP